jgi:hypothetical protein
MDELLAREGISADEYYRRLGQTRITFWVQYWGEEKVLEEWSGFWELVELGIVEEAPKYEVKKVEKAKKFMRKAGKPE